MSNSFELKYSGKVDNVIPVFKYRSKDTGLSVVVAQVGGPLVNGYFCLATEAHDDDGLPHTLEHLVFMGSEQYPYKGVLDLLANRCLASGTNAWTDTDHTCYTMTTAGSEGFLNLMPIYLDHVLYPTLTESAYVTEVHHVNDEGEDAGVVYCEMQACENTGENRVRRAMLDAMYPGHCGYKSETGGAMKNLRESTSHKKVCDYHREFYRPENLCLVITGQVEPEEVCKRLGEFEQRIKSKGPLPTHTRPWQSAVPPLEKSIQQTVKYPSDEEENGMFVMAWRGPKAKDQYTMSALTILCEYLTDTAVAPLQRDFVEIQDPFCNDVKYSITENSEGCFYIKFTNVPVGKLSKVQDLLMAALRKLGSGEEAIDMSRMQVVVKKREQEAMSALEDEPHDTIAFYIIGDFLYGDNNEDLDTRLNVVKTYKQLEKEGADYWKKMINTYLLNDKYVAIIGEPSKSKMEEMGAEEKARVQKQRDTLGDEGLKQKADDLEKATDDNEEEPPEEMLTCVPVPDVGCIHFHPISPSSNHDNASANENKHFPLADMPVTFQLDDIQTKFVDITVLLETSGLSKDLQYYLPLYTEAITEAPVMRNGQLISHEQVITELEADTVSYGCSIGISGSRFKAGEFATVLSLSMKVIKDKYEKGISWMRELLYAVQFKPDRLKIIAAKMANDVAGMKRRGRTVVSCAVSDMLYKKDHVSRTSNMLRQHKFLIDLMEKLDKPETAEPIVDKMNELRHVITNPANLRVHVSANAQGLAGSVDPARAWKQDFLPEGVKPQGDKPVTKPGSTMLQSAQDSATRAVILGVGSVESSFMVQCTPSITDYNHPDLAAIMVYIQYLTQLEGPMWRQIRGLGLSYHYSMYLKPENGQLYFILFKSTHLVNAYKEGKEILDGFLTGKTEFSEVEFESCKSSLIFEIIEEEKTPTDASHESMMSYFRGVSKDYNRKLLAQIPKVTLDDMKRIGDQYIAPVFDVTKTTTAIVCHPTKVQGIQTEMKEGFGMDLKVIENMEESFLGEI